MQLSQKQIVIIAAVLVIVVAVVVLIVLNIRPSTSSEKATIVVWGLDDKGKIDAITEGYKKLRSNVTVEYVELEARNYKNVLLGALAAGEGPDVFYLSNRDLPQFQKALYPAISSQLSLVSFREFFPAAAEDDFVRGGQVYAVPLYFDTLALFYNKDLFNQAGIVSPPKTWEEFQGIVPRLRVLNQSGQIVRAAAAIGGSNKTIDKATDLLELLMLQNGTKMTSTDFTYASFNSGGGNNPGLAAFNFYLQFANAGSPYYTWNDGQQNSLDSFASGKTAMIFNYHSTIAAIKSKSPFLNFDVAGAPQPSGLEVSVNYGEYYGLAVSRQSKAPTWAWDFVTYLTTYPDIARSYLGSTGRPPALRTLIGEKMADPDFNVFARQALTARSWYEADSAKIDEIFNSAIQSVLSGQADSGKALSQAQDQVSQLMRGQ